MSEILEKFASLRCDVEDVSPEDVKWNFEVKELRSFIDWSLKYVEESNSLDSRESKEFLKWCESDNELHGEDLDEALAQFGVDIKVFPHSDLSLFDVELLDSELDHLRVEEHVLSDSLSILSKEIQSSLSNEENLEKKLKSAQLDCQREGQNLMKINVPLKSNLSNFVHNLSFLDSILRDSQNPEFQNRFLPQLDSFIYQSEKFTALTSQILRREFEKSSTEKQPIYDLTMLMERENSIRSSSLSISSSLPHRMWKVGMNNIVLHGSLCGYAATTKNIEHIIGTTFSRKSNMLQIQIDSNKIQDEISRLAEEIDFISKHEVANIMEDVVLSHIINATHQLTKARIERRALRLRKLRTITGITNKFLYLTDLLWMLLMDECQRRKVGVELLKEFTGFLQGEIDRHKATMGTLGSINNENKLYQNAASNGQYLLIGVLQRLSNLNTIDDDSGNGTLCESQFENEMKDLECTELLDVLRSHTMQCSSQDTLLQNLCSELTNGPTYKPCLFNRDLSLKIQLIEKKLLEYDNELEALNRTFKVKQMAFKKSPMLRNSRLLWAWFLVAPDKLRNALSLAKSAGCC